jgi:hypothetical protein
MSKKSNIFSTKGSFYAPLPPGPYPRERISPQRKQNIAPNHIAPTRITYVEELEKKYPEFNQDTLESFDSNI